MTNTQIIPLCLYKYKDNPNQNYICYPNLVKRNDKVVYGCPDKENMEFMNMFYAINPDFRPLPQGTQLFCAMSTDVNTTSFETMYDMFNNKKGCIRFIAWDKPVPYTTRLTITNLNDAISVTVGKDDVIEDNRNTLSLYVLFDPRDNVPRIGSGQKFPIIASVPQFLFSSYNGRCIPDPSGKTLEECTVNNILNMRERPSLLNYLGSRYKMKDTSPVIAFLFGMMLIAVISFGILRMRK